jgi:transcriptional regulator with XRE-family HTH domain
MEQADMAAQLGISRQTVSNWEIGRNEISATARIRLAELTRISMRELGFGTVRPEGFEASLVALA